jgi:hypothetical protein
VFEYHTKNGGSSELTMEDAATLTSQKKSAADEMISTDDPMIAKNAERSKARNTALLEQLIASLLVSWLAR